MAILRIEGDDRQLKAIAKQVNGRATKYGLSISFQEDNQEVLQPPVFDLHKPEKTAKEVAELIENCTSLEELKVYKSDNRQISKAAYNKKLKELE